MNNKLKKFEFSISLLNSIREIIEASKIEQTVKEYGYFSKFEYGKVEQKRQIDWFVSYSVLNGDGTIVETFDDGFLTAYEALATLFSSRYVEKTTASLNAFLNDLLKIKNHLISNTFLLSETQGENIANKREYDSQKIIKKQLFSERNDKFLLIEIVTPTNGGDYLKIGDMITINHKEYAVRYLY